MKKSKEKKVKKKMDDSVIKFSRLQKKILMMLRREGKCEEIAGVYEDIKDPKRTNLEWQRKKLQLVRERGWLEKWREKDFRGEICTNYRIVQYRLLRSELACNLFNWHRHRYNPYPGITRGSYFISEPSGYNSRQVVLTNSLKSLEAKGCVEFLTYYEDPLEEDGRKNAKIMQLTTKGIKKAEELLNIKSKGVN